jgi:hypothetical protein
MTTNEYLAKVLRAQTLQEGSDELKTLQERRAEVEKHIRTAFEKSSPTIRYGGSKAKGTMIREAYDLDVISYFANDDTGAGETLEAIYSNVKEALGKHYLVIPKTSALRLTDPNPTSLGIDFHIDVVPGRFTDASKTDAYLYLSTGDKCRLKTNLNVHITHVRDSGVTDAIRLVKLWKVRNGINLKSFGLELLVIKLLKDKKNMGLVAQLEHIWTELRDGIDDPANPTGNDLSALLNDSVKVGLAAVARRTLSLLEQSGWVAVFGPVEEEKETHKKEDLVRTAVASVTSPSKPWSRDE